MGTSGPSRRARMAISSSRAPSASVSLWAGERMLTLLDNEKMRSAREQEDPGQAQRDQCPDEGRDKHEQDAPTDDAAARLDRSYFALHGSLHWFGQGGLKGSERQVEGTVAPARRPFSPMASG